MQIPFTENEAGLGETPCPYNEINIIMVGSMRCEQCSHYFGKKDGNVFCNKENYFKRILNDEAHNESRCE